MKEKLGDLHVIPLEVYDYITALERDNANMYSTLDELMQLSIQPGALAVSTTILKDFIDEVFSRLEMEPVFEEPEEPPVPTVAFQIVYQEDES